MYLAKVVVRHPLGLIQTLVDYLGRKIKGEQVDQQTPLQATLEQLAGRGPARPAGPAGPAQPLCLGLW